jgi:AraC family transcriptional regulator of arabinose operon
MERMLISMHKMTNGSPPPPSRTPAELALLRSPDRHEIFEVPSKSQLRQGLWVGAVGSHRALPPHSLAREVVRDRFAAVWISRLTGEGMLSTALAGRHAISAPTLFWIQPGVRHTYTPVTGTWDEHWVVFGGSLAEELRRQGMIDPARGPLTLAGDEEIPALFARIAMAFRAGGPLAVPLAASLTWQLIVRAHGMATGLLGSPGRVDREIASTLALIERDFALGLSPRALARRIPMAYSTLRRRFKAQTGSSIKEYTLRVQIRRAKELLSGTALPVRAVAEEVGVVNPLYFSRLFAQREGVSPLAFRRASHGLAPVSGRPGR